MRRMVTKVLLVLVLALGSVASIVYAPPASAMSIDCQPAGTGVLCEVIHDDGSKEYFWVK